MKLSGVGIVVRVIVAISIILGCLVAGAPAFAQSIPPDDRPNELAAAAPAGVGLFIELDRLSAGGDSPRAKMAARVFDLLLGAGDDNATDWQRSMQSLGIKPGQTATDVFAHRVAIAAPSWKRLGEGILIVRLTPEHELINNVFPPDSNDPIDEAGSVVVYRTHNVLSAAMTGRLLIISQRHGTGSLYQKSVDLMTGRSTESLASDPEYLRLIGSLEEGLDGFAYVSDDGIASALGIASQVRRFAVGTRLDENGAQFTFKAAGAIGNPADTSDDDTRRQRVGQLPRTTVAAWSMPLDVPSALEQAIRLGSTGEAPAFLSTLAKVFDVETMLHELTGKLGSGVIVTWDQQLGTGANVPQIGVLFESTDAAGADALLAEGVQVVVDWLDVNRANGNSTGRLGLSQFEYMGATVHELTLPDSRDESGRPGGREVLPRPAFAAVDGWLVLATSADQLRNIIDARWGLTPQLGDITEKSFDGAGMFGVLQPALAAQVVESWLNDSQGFLSGWFGGNGKPADARTVRQSHVRLGIGTRPGAEPGSVLVATVRPNGRAHGYLFPGDRICGVNGELLALTESTGDLRRRIASPPETGHWSFRVRRADEWLDVVVPADSPRRISALDANPAAAMSQLQSVLKMVDLATFRVSPPRDGITTATVHLRLAERG